MIKKVVLLFILAIVFLLLYWNLGHKQNPPNPIPFVIPTTSQIQKEKAIVTRVVDGDTIVLQDGRRVRYIGMNTPEIVDPRRPVECFGKEASEKNKELVEGKEVELEKDVSETDKYGRLLRYVYVDNLLVNDYLVRNGYAYASSYPPDVTYQKQFLESQREAQIQKLGLWNSC